MLIGLGKFLTDVSQLDIDGTIVLISGIIFLATAVCAVVNWVLDIIHEFTGSKESAKSTKFQYYHR